MKTRSGLPRHCTYQFDRDGKLAATRLANAGCSSEQIKAITGHRSDSGLAPYIRKANKARLARQARELTTSWMRWSGTARPMKNSPANLSLPNARAFRSAHGCSPS